MRVLADFDWTRVVCSSNLWTQIDTGQLPAPMNYLKVAQTNISRLPPDMFEVTSVICQSFSELQHAITLRSVYEQHSTSNP